MNISNFDISNVIIKDPTMDNFGGYHLEFKYERNGKEGFLNLACPLLRTDMNGVTPFKNKDGTVAPDARLSVKVCFPRRKPVFVPNKDDHGNILPGGYFDEPEMAPSDPKDPNSEMVVNTYEESDRLLEIFEEIYQKALDHCFKNRHKLKLSQYKDRNMMEVAIKNPIYRRSVSEDDPTEDLTTPPSLYVKLIQSGPHGNPPNVIYTTFSGITNEKIQPDMLKDTMMYLVPTIRVSKIFLGGKSSNIQCSLTNALVFSVKPRSEVSVNKEVINAAIEQNPGLLDALVAGLQKIATERNIAPLPAEEKPPVPTIIASPVPEAIQDLSPKEEEEGEEEEGLEDFMERRKPPAVRRTIKRQE